MAMSGLAKYFVNREARGLKNFQALRKYLSTLPMEEIHAALEIGCGIGTVSASLVQNYPLSAWGTDYDPGQIDAARHFYPETERLHFQVEDAASFSFGDSTFALVITQNVLHHVPQWEKAIGEIARVMRPGGYCLYDDFVIPAGLKALVRRMGRDRTPYTFDEILGTCSRNHLTIQRQERSMRFIFPRFLLVLAKITS